jgi:uncharacterized membrane protein
MAGPPFGDRLTPLFAVVTLPLGILAFLFADWQAAAVVFVIGWFLLVPASAILFGPSWEEEMESYADWQETAERVDRAGGSEATNQSDPVDELRDRYARGEIDEDEFERRLGGLLETEDVDAADQDAVERAVERLSEGESEPGDGPGNRAERDAELERGSE